jgi:hypothetical protein
VVLTESAAFRVNQGSLSGNRKIKSRSDLGAALVLRTGKDLDRHGGAVEATTVRAGLFLSVFLGMNLSCFFRVVSRVSGVARGRMGVMGRLLVMASFVVLGSFTVMAGCVGMMLRSLLVMLGCFFGHGVSLDWKFTV